MLTPGRGSAHSSAALFTLSFPWQLNRCFQMANGADPKTFQASKPMKLNLSERICAALFEVSANQGRHD